jgi:HEAT repeat protein
MELLNDEVENVRWFAIKTLQKMDARQAIPEIRKLLTAKTDRGTFIYAIKALGYFKDTESSGEIVKILQDKDAVIREVAIYALRDIGVAREAKPEIMKLVRDEYGGVRHAIVMVFRDLFGKQDVSEIMELLKEKDSGIRGMASLLLKELGDKEAIPVLVELMKNEDGTTRGWAAIILVELEAKDRLPKESIEDIKIILKWREDYAQRARSALKELGVAPEGEDKK